MQGSLSGTSETAEKTAIRRKVGAVRHPDDSDLKGACHRSEIQFDAKVVSARIDLRRTRAVYRRGDRG